MHWYLIAGLACAAYVALFVVGMAEQDAKVRRLLHPQAVEPLGMRIARLEHANEMLPPFEHPPGCVQCRPMLARWPDRSGVLYREGGAIKGMVAGSGPVPTRPPLPKGLLTGTGALSANEVRQLQEMWVRNHARAAMVLDEGVVFQQVTERLDEIIGRSLGVPPPGTSPR